MKTRTRPLPRLVDQVLGDNPRIVDYAGDRLGDSGRMARTPRRPHE